MALQKQRIYIPFGAGGLNQLQSDKVSDPTVLKTLDNAIIEKTGAIQKIKGRNKIDLNIIDPISGDVSFEKNDINLLFGSQTTMRGEVALARTGLDALEDSVFSHYPAYTTAEETFNLSGPSSRMTHTLVPVDNAPVDPITFCESARMTGYQSQTFIATITKWREDLNPNPNEDRCIFTVHDEDTNTLIYKTNLTIPANCDKVCLRIFEYFQLPRAFVFYEDGTSIKYHMWIPIYPALITSATLQTGVGDYWDLEWFHDENTAADSFLFLIYKPSASYTFAMKTYSTILVTIATVENNNNSIDDWPCARANYFGQSLSNTNSLYKVSAAWLDGTDIKYYQGDRDLGSTANFNAAVKPIAKGSVTTADRLSICYDHAYADDTYVRIIYQDSDQIVSSLADSDGGGAAAAGYTYSFYGSWHLMSKLFVNPITYQSSVFIKQTDAFSPGLYLAHWVMNEPNGDSDDGTSIIFDSVIGRDYGFYNTNDYGPISIFDKKPEPSSGTVSEKIVVGFDTTTDSTYYWDDYVEVRQSYYAIIDPNADSDYVSYKGKYNLIGGGNITLFDQRACPLPFLHSPGVIEALTNPGGSGIGTFYYYRAIYYMEDAAGNIYRSAPSPVATGEMGSSNILIRVKPYIPNSAYWAKKCNIVLYRLGTDGKYHFLDWMSNDPTAQAGVNYQFIDAAASSVDSNEFLYTTGGVLDNTECPSPLSLASGKGRMWCISCDDQTKLWYSKIIADGLGVSWSAALTMQIDGQPLIGLVEIEDKILAFKKRSIHLVTGVGPNNKGQGSAFSQQTIIEGIGAVSRRSILATKLGVFFQSLEGIKLLDKSFQVQDFDEIKDYKGDEVVAAEYDGDAAQVYFALDTGVWLLFDLDLGIWSTIDDRECSNNAMTIYNNQLYYCNAGDLYQTNYTKYHRWIDVSTYDEAVISTIETNWLYFNGQGGHQRIYELVLVGEYAGGAHTLNVELYYDYKDYDGSVVQTVTFTPSEVIGTSWAEYRVRIKPGKQKCTAFRLKIFDSGFASDSYELPWRLHGINATIGVKGLAKLGTDNSK